MAWAGPDDQRTESSVSPPTEADARALTIRAKRAFDAGRFVEAAELLKRAYSITPSPALLYNLGRAYQQAGDNQRAVEAYEHYLATALAPRDAGAVQQSIDQLRHQLAEQAALGERVTAESARAEQAERDQAEAEKRGRHKPRALPWILTGAGAGGIGAGVILGVLARSAHDDAVADPDADSARGKQSRASSLALGANVVFIASGALVLTGVVWGIFDRRAAARGHRIAGVTVGIGPGTMTLSAAF